MGLNIATEQCYIFRDSWQELSAISWELSSGKYWEGTGSAVSHKYNAAVEKLTLVWDLAEKTSLLKLGEYLCCCRQAVVTAHLEICVTGLKNQGTVIEFTSVMGGEKDASGNRKSVLAQETHKWLFFLKMFFVEVNYPILSVLCSCDSYILLSLCLKSLLR